ncbi:LEA type 2 family protein [Nitrosopumilus sp. K4]|uniref:NDR1/HIN1-like protein n=1 Tax=Nitrosopumilus sp. K4 TaxID=2795383 RepID=UPI001BAAE2FB|nr:LEA type 2 family protein [Nitrosopumilus sp. K4]QUC65537.1 LEA type 2 family protein [Nitrosopumilus sp. K4]
MSKAIGIGIAIIVMILVVAGLFVYSYTQISVELSNVQLHSIDWATLSWPALINLGLDALTGNWFGAAFELIDGVNLNLIFAVQNKGILPVYIPDLSYDIFVNGISIGKGSSKTDITINPGNTKEITSFQNFKKDRMGQAVFSIIDTKGIMDIKVKGTAFVKFLGIDIPIPFESSRQISIYDEVRNTLNKEIQKNNQKSVGTTVGKSIENAIGAFVNDLLGGEELELSLQGQKFIDSTYTVEPGSYTFVSFSLNCDAKIQGGFLSKSMLGDDIMVFVFDDYNFGRYSDGLENAPIYDSGKTKSATFEMTLPSGEYHIVMSNEYSIISTKNVQFQVASICV